MNIFILLIFIGLQIILISAYITSFLNLDGEILILGVPVHILFMFFLNIGTFLLLSKMYIDELKRKIKQTEVTYDEQFQSLVTSVRSDRHDLNNHLTVISGLMKIKNFTIAENYLNQMVNEVKINNKALTINNPILASILFSKMELFQKENISFDIDIQSETISNKLSSTDLIRIVSNLLDNAFEATVELPKQERKIVLEMKESQDKYNIILKNTSKQKIDPKLFEMGFSTKFSQDRERGFGLSILQEIIKKYKGTLNVKNENSLVIFDISFSKENK